MTRSTGKTTPLILGIGGGLGGDSQNLIALRAALSACEKAGGKTDLIDIQALQLPMLEPNKELAEYPARVQEYVDKVAAADGYIWSSPAYHGTISGVVKNALDFIEYLSQRTPPYLDGKPVGLISTAGGTMADVTTIQALQHVAHALRAWVIPLSVPIHQAWEVIEQSGRIKEPKIEERLALLGQEMVRFFQVG